MRFLLTWIALAAFWLGLSGHFDAVHLVYGFLSVTLVAWISHHHLYGEGSVLPGLGRLGRLVLYTPWLLWQITLANVDVFLRVVGIRSVDPRMMRFRSDLDSVFGRTALANSITLTPGTVTVEVEEDGTFLVHAIAPAVEETLDSGAMERRVEWVAGDES